MVAACFSEPDVEDPTPGQPGESRGEWLRRSTWERARQTRHFYNANLAYLPATIRDRLCREIHADRSEAKHFELVVGRFLQVLGAEQLEYEPVGSEGRQIDWLAHFPDGPVSVEATAPVVNAVVGDSLEATDRVVQMVIRAAPAGWHVMVLHSPRFGPNESLQRLRADLRALFAGVPEGSKGEHLTVTLECDTGALEIALIGASELGPARYGGGPAVGYIDNTSEVIHRAVEGKRLQARGAVKPVFAALYTAGFGSHEVDKFDIGLLGRTVHGGGFLPTGVFGSGHATAFAGALAFAYLGMHGGPDPILYLHPAHSEAIPAAFTGLRRRELRGDAIVETPPDMDGLLTTLGWPEA